MSDDIRDRPYEPLKTVRTSEHPLWPAFSAWAREAVPGAMLDVYWQAFLAGAAAARKHGKPDPAAPTPTTGEPPR